MLNTLYSGGGVREIARQLSLDNLEGLSATVFFLRIAEFVCPDGGPNDEGMARSAYFDAIAENISILDKPTEALTSEECTSILQHFMCKVIMEHIVNDIANKIIVLPKDIDTVSHIEDDVEQMIKQSVADDFVEVNKNDGVITNTKAQEITDAVYQETYEILEGLGD